MALLSGKRNIQDDEFILIIVHARAAPGLSLDFENQGNLHMPDERTGGLLRVAT
ncbi:MULTISPECIES: hypothetical protein [Acetobacter]|jgi:hypothetical protein|uniref:Uncharacterized protein n=1 Tax=Acetobacter lovaniensis TaxID=104100 RepID=A0A841QB07_9PROT|nr:hypothetical protein [Acetobacter lovaniensis]MBB6455473.1 hypothetical protein [Acetobacter lovaniensis]MCI1697591.1 hypothetical protein [Acetobacter lovaniensis]MCI1795345.1 hypothetical protein [Acetobacter lovaniensis]MCP1238690.1 hypothetical protein [Acetobacter lovaniensis]NHN79877.1 hypothetical protein [Acetobacter lovaniensis]